MLSNLVNADRQLFQWLNQQAYLEVLDPLAIFLTTISNGALIWWVIAVILLMMKKRLGSYLPGIALAVGVGVAYLVESALNALINRPRPPLAEDEVRQLVELPLSSSFPSGHATTSFAALYVLLFFFPTAKYWAPLLVVLFAYSRIYVGVHYPLDMLSGVLLGLLVAALTTKGIIDIAKKRREQSQKKD